MDAFYHASHEQFPQQQLKEQYKVLGFNRVDLHYLGSEQETFIRTFAGKILPSLRQAA